MYSALHKSLSRIVGTTLRRQSTPCESSALRSYALRPIHTTTPALSSYWAESSEKPREPTLCIYCGARRRHSPLEPVCAKCWKLYEKARKRLRMQQNKEDEEHKAWKQVLSPALNATMEQVEAANDIEEVPIIYAVTKCMQQLKERDTSQNRYSYRKIMTKELPYSLRIIKVGDKWKCAKAKVDAMDFALWFEHYRRDEPIWLKDYRRQNLPPEDAAPPAKPIPGRTTSLTAEAQIDCTPSSRDSGLPTQPVMRSKGYSKKSETPLQVCRAANKCYSGSCGGMDLGACPLYAVDGTLFLRR